jgi:hypothetical protein
MNLSSEVLNALNRAAQPAHRKKTISFAVEPKIPSGMPIHLRHRTSTHRFL